MKKEKTMPEDPLVREVRQARDALARKFNYDVEAIIRDLMARQGEICEGHTLVRDVNEFDRESESRKIAAQT
jgi:hypothetical protein